MLPNNGNEMFISTFEHALYPFKFIGTNKVFFVLEKISIEKIIFVKVIFIY